MLQRHTIGLMGFIRNAQALRNNPADYLLQLGQQAKVVHFRLGPVQLYFLNHPPLIKQVLLDHNDAFSRETLQYRSLAQVTGQGLLTTDGPTWQAHRKLLTPAFAPAQVAMLDSTVVPATDQLLKSWQDGQHIDMDDAMMRLTLEIVGRAIFGIDLAAEAAPLVQAVLTTLDHLIYQSQHPFAPPAWVPTRQNRRFRAALRALDAAVAQILANAPASEDPPGSNRAVLHLLRTAQDAEGRPLSLKAIRDEVLTLLIAGHETAASALSWTWDRLAHHPEVAERLREEVLRVVGERPLTSKDLQSLPYTKAVFAEALRLYPPAWVLSRRTLRPVELEGLTLPKGSLVVISPYALQRAERYWPDPDRFDPDRFLDPQRSRHARFSYLPFGAGPRVCIGGTFAQTEGQLILASMGRAFRFEPVHTSPPALAGVTLRPLGGLPLRAQPWR